MSSSSRPTNMEDCKSSRTMCNVCADEVSCRKITECPACRFGACSTCIKRFLIESLETIPKCMNCKKGWTLEFVFQEFDTKFYESYKVRRAYLFQEQQKILLPDTQHLVQSRKKEEEIKEQLDEIAEETMMFKLLIKKNKEKSLELRRELFALPTVNDSKEVAREAFTRACPRADCRGFLSSALKCGTCDGWACKDCREPKNEQDDPEHKCDPNTVETIKLLASDTKKCPGCHSLIYKVNGCDQMWCTKCHTLFDWKSGKKLENQVNHNPEYYKWKRENTTGNIPRVQGDVQCGGLPDLHRLELHIKKLGAPIDFIFNLHRLVNHILHVELPRYPPTIDNKVLAEMRIQYLIGNLSEKKWLKQLKEHTKKSEKNTSINQIMRMFTDATTDILGNILTCTTAEQLTTTMDSLEHLRDYTNKAFAKIGYMFNNVYPHISIEWSYRSNSKTIKSKKIINLPGRIILAPPGRMHPNIMYQ